MYLIVFHFTDTHLYVFSVALVLPVVHNKKIKNVGGSQGRGEPSIELGTGRRSRVKTFVEMYDMVTVPSGEGHTVKKDRTGGTVVEFQ